MESNSIYHYGALGIRRGFQKLTHDSEAKTKNNNGGSKLSKKKSAKGQALLGPVLRSKGNAPLTTLNSPEAKRSITKGAANS